MRHGTAWTLKDFKALIGDSDLTGEFALDTDGTRLALRGDLRSQTLVVDELTGYAPEKKPGRVEPEKVQVPAKVPEKAQEHPQAIEVNVRFRSNKVIVAKVPLEQFSTDLQWHNDRLALTPTSPGWRHGPRPSADRHAGPPLAEHDPHHDAPDQRATVAGLARAET